MSTVVYHPWSNRPRKHRRSWISPVKRNISADLDAKLEAIDDDPQAEREMPRMLSGWDPVRVATAKHFACGEEYGWAE